MTLVNGAGTAANSKIAAVLFCAGLLPQCVVCCVTWKGGKTDTPVYNSAYIEGIHNLYEFDVGKLSG